MRITHFLLALSLLSASAAPAFGLGKKKQRTMVSFHLETSEDEAPKFAFPHTLPGTNIKRYFKITPEFTDRQIAWFHPFPSKDGRGFGLIFQLDESSAIRLEALSAQNRGKYLVTSFLGAQAAPILIDRPVTDGIIVVWDGVSEAQIAMLSEQLSQYQDPANPVDPKQYKKDMKKKSKKVGQPDDPGAPILQLPQPDQATALPAPASPQPWSGATTPMPSQPAPAYSPAPTNPAEPPLPQSSPRGEKIPVYRPGFDF